RRRAANAAARGADAHPRVGTCLRASHRQRVSRRRRQPASVDLLRRAHSGPVGEGGGGRLGDPHLLRRRRRIADRRARHRRGQVVLHAGDVLAGRSRADAARPPGVRSAEPVQSRQDLPDAAFVRRGPRPVPPPSGRGSRRRRTHVECRVLKPMQTTADPPATDIVQPSTPGEVAAARKRASDEGRSMVIRGAGTKMDWGRPAARIDVMLDMRRLNRVLTHAHGDLTATVEAGATLRDVNDTLSRLGQGLPIDPAFADEATIGGILATNDSGPLRHRYGAPRDLILGVHLATTDGVLTKAGGQVVKNVAGYDLSKLIAGSFGSLAAIVSATFKLFPIPEASKTMRVAVADEASLTQVVRRMMGSQLEPMAFEVDVRSRSTQNPQNPQSKNFSASAAASAFNVLLRFASLPVVVDAQVAGTTEALKGIATSIDVVEGYAERMLW